MLAGCTTKMGLERIVLGSNKMNKQVNQTKGETNFCKEVSTIGKVVHGSGGSGLIIIRQPFEHIRVENLKN